MCFKNLPVEFDAAGKARLRDGIPDPYSVAVSKPHVGVTDADREAQIQRLMAANGHVKDINMDPVTRVAGALAVHVVADLAEGRCDGQRDPDRIAEERDDRKCHERLGDDDHEQDGGDRGRVGQQEHRVEQHPDRHEEQHREGVPQRQRVSGRLVTHVRLAHDQAGQEGTERKGHAKDRR